MAISKNILNIPVDPVVKEYCGTRQMKKPMLISSFFAVFLTFAYSICIQFPASTSKSMKHYRVKPVGQQKLWLTAEQTAF